MSFYNSIKVKGKNFKDLRQEIEVAFLGRSID